MSGAGEKKMDTTGDGKVKFREEKDTTGDGKIDVVRVDSTGDRKIDTIYKDTTGDGHYDKVAESGRRPSGAACAKWQHTDRLQNLAKLRRFRIGGGRGIGGRIGAGYSEFQKNAAFWKNPEKIWSNLAKIQQNSGKNCKILEKKKQKIQQFLTKQLRLENGAKECIV